MKVITLKLINGDEIIGREISSDVDSTTLSITLSKVFALRVHQAADGQMGVGMMPWVVSHDGEMILDRRHILAGPFLPPSDLERGFMSQTSGLLL